MRIEQQKNYGKLFTERMSNKGTCDVYDVLRMFNISDPMLQHAIKKLLVMGGRSGGKTEKQDFTEAMMTLEEFKKEKLWK